LIIFSPPDLKLTESGEEPPSCFILVKACWENKDPVTYTNIQSLSEPVENPLSEDSLSESDAETTSSVWISTFRSILELSR
jgi:hypothetical protein